MRNVRRRRFLLSASALVAAQFAHAQSRPLISVLAASTKLGARHLMGAFVSRLEALGWRDGQNVVIRYRYADGDTSKMTLLAEEIVAERPNVIFAPPDPGAVAVQRLTREIPIVFAIASDPVGSGLAKSLARPGGNATGLTNINADLSAKRMQLLREFVPAIKRIGVLFNGEVPNEAKQIAIMQKAAASLGVRILPLSAATRTELEQSFEQMVTRRAEGCVILADALLFTYRQWLAERTRNARLASIGSFAEYPDAGGLAGYAVDFPAQFRRAAEYVDRILKGARPADLPIEQPTRMELVINLLTAKALGIAVPQSLLLRADRVIQ